VVSGYSHVCAAFSNFGIVCNSAAVKWCTFFVKILSCMCCLILAGKIFELQYRMGCVDGGCALWDAFTQVEQICCESKPNAYFGLQCLSMFYKNFSCWKYKK
jgi:hypothetical protein